MMSTGDYDFTLPDGAPQGLGWERRAELGPAVAIVQTVREVVFSPTAAFRRMNRGGGWAEPLGFGVLVGSISIWMAQFWDMVTRSLLAGVTGISVDEVAAANAQEVWLALLAPLFVCAATALGAAIVHVLLIAFGGAAHPYEATFRVFCYTWSVGVFNVVPICGLLIAAVWRVVVQIIGIREAQEVPTGRAAAAVLVPLVVACFCLLMLSIVVFGVAGLAAAGLQ